MDPYVYPGTSVLRNLRDVRAPEELSQFEGTATARRIAELAHHPIRGTFDTSHLQAIHRYIFQDVYAWAGEFRTVDISKGGHLFGLYQHIVPFLHKTFVELQMEKYLAGTRLKHFAHRAAHYLGEINAIHPFRDGNGRTQREFIRNLAVRNGYALDWSRVSRDQMIGASRQSFRSDNAGLERALRAALENEHNRIREQEPWRSY